MRQHLVQVLCVVMLMLMPGRRRVLLRPEVIGLIAGGAFMTAAHGPYYTFYSIHLVGGTAALLGELSHLFGDDREATPMLPGTRGLDRRIERQQVGLIGDGLNRAREADDLGECELEAIHLALRPIDDELRAIEDLERLENAGPRL